MWLFILPAPVPESFSMASHYFQNKGLNLSHKIYIVQSLFGSHHAGCPCFPCCCHPGLLEVSLPCHSHHRASVPAMQLPGQPSPFLFAYLNLPSDHNLSIPSRGKLLNLPYHGTTYFSLTALSTEYLVIFD